MSVIQIRERGVAEHGFEVSLHIDSQDYGRVVVKAPFADQPQKDADLIWYFEEWLRMPFIDRVRADRSASSVREYGESLFDQVFSDRDAYSAYGAIKNDLNRLEIEIIGGSAEFQAWHWEALCDPGLPRPLAVDCRLVRKHTQRTPIGLVVKESPVVNVLLVTARPGEEDDVGYRTISRSMVEMVKNAHLRVNIEILRPATYQALIERLSEKGAGYYHILHFDGHGALMTHEQYLAGMQGDRLSFQRGYGLGNLAEYAGSKAFLFFDGDAKGQSSPVEAQELASLLQGKQIPICILNACQSAMQLADERETSLGSQLMAAGMQAVVAMGYSVTVTAAKVLMTKLYGELFGGKDFATAVRLGRYELYNNKQRQGYFSTWIDLEDWLLPVVYGSSAVNLNLREFAPAEEEAYYEGLGSRYRFELPSYGFVGRDLDILKIEKGLLRHNVLLLRGMGGTGKTTLLSYLREWWQTTNFADDVFYFGYDRRAWTLAQILFEIGQRVYDRFESARFVAMSGAAQMSKLAEKLRSTNYIVVLDNLESVTGQQLAIQNTLNANEQADLRDFLALLVGGKTRVVLGSRAGEEWLQGVFRENVYVLRGLDLEARSELAELILRRQVAASRVQEIKQDGDFQKLMRLLAGYPLAMEVVLANLRRQSPGEVLGALRLADVGLDGVGQDKTTSILKCVEYSHSNLSEAAQQLLLCLAPFSSFIFRDGIPGYAEELQKLEPFKDYDFAGFDTAIQEAINWGLLSPIHDDNERLLSIQPMFPYFLKTSLSSDDLRYSSLTEGFKNHYQNLASSYNALMESQNPQRKKLGAFFCRYEYENLYAALQECLSRHESISIYFCLNLYFNIINNIQAKLKMAELVNKLLSENPSKYANGEYWQEVLIASDYLANSYLETNQYEKAKFMYEDNLKNLNDLQFIELEQKNTYTAIIYHQLGLIAQEFREWEKARNNYSKSLDYADLYSQARTYHQLGTIADELREWNEARYNYYRSLEICEQFDDRYNQAKIYHQLAMVAQHNREWENAHENYIQSLKICVEFDDEYSQASTYQQLGVLAQELRKWTEAHTNYHRAFSIYMKFGDKYSQARVYYQLGTVSQELREWEEALNNYSQSLSMYSDFGEIYEQSAIYYQTGKVFQKLGDRGKAQNNYLQTMEIMTKFRDHYGQAKVYHQLGILAQEIDQWEEAKNNYLQALEILIKFNDRYNQSRVYHQLGIVEQESKQWDNARSHYLQALEIKIEFDDRYLQASTYGQLGLLAEATGDPEEAIKNMLLALEIFSEYEDDHGIRMTMNNIAQTFQSCQRSELISKVAKILGVSESEVQQIFDSMDQGA